MVQIFIAGSFVVGITIRVPRMPVPGEGLIGDMFDLGPGGKGTNQAIGAARLGAKVGLTACLGDDMFADMAINLFEKENIDSRYIRRVPGVNTGVGCVTLLPTGENCIAGHLGANQFVTPQDVEEAESFIAKSDIVLAQLEVPVDTVIRAMELGRKHKALNILNPAPAKVLPADLLREVDIITPNETEARILLGLSPDDPVPIADLGGELMKLGVRTIVVTMGKQGAMIVTKEGTEHMPAPCIQPIDATGAGDAFNAALAVSLGSGLSLREAVARANYAGAYAAMHLGVISGLPAPEELCAFIEKCKGAGI